MTSRETSYLRELPAWALGMHNELPPRQAGDITVTEMADHWLVTCRTARDRLKRMARDGLLVEAMVFDAQHPKKRVMIFRPAPGVKPGQVVWRPKGAK